MKRTFLFAAVLAVLSLASCKKDNDPQVPTGPDEPGTSGLVNTDANNWVLYSNGFYEGVSSANDAMTEVEEGDTKLLKWVFASDAAWANYGVLNLDPYLDLKDANADKAVLKVNFKVEKDGGPVSQHTLFRVYFGASDGNNAVDYWPGAVGRGEASTEWYNIVVNDNEWHELTLPLKDYVAKLSGVGAARQLGFTPKDAPAAVGTTVLFKDIRLENCAVSHPTPGEPSVDPTPDTPKEFTALIYDDEIHGTWVLDGTAGKFTATTDEHSAGTKSVKWYCESAWFNSACVFRLPKGETKDISSYSKLKFDVKITATGNASEHPFEPGDEAFTIRTYSDGTAEYSESYYVYCARTTAEGGEGDWHTVEIPLKTSTDPNDKWNCFVIQSGSGAYPLKNFNQFCFHNMDWSGNAGNIYIDNITLVK